MARKINKREIKPPKWRICTEGFTEAIYLDSLLCELGIREAVDLNCDTKRNGCGRQHKALFDQAQKCRREPRYEKIFMIHDFDGADDSPKSWENFTDAYKSVSMDSGIEFIVSIPCFEYWLLLHFEACEADYDRWTCQNKLRGRINKIRRQNGQGEFRGDGYKACKDLWELVNGMKGLEDAERRAEEMLTQKGIDDSLHNRQTDLLFKKFKTDKPITTMPFLLQQLRKHPEYIKRRRHL